MQLFAHRGVSDLAPENSMAAFELALEQQCDGIELDVRLMSGQVVVMHDASVDRTTNGTGLVSQLSVQQWQQLDAGNGSGGCRNDLCYRPPWIQANAIMCLSL